MYSICNPLIFIVRKNLTKYDQYSKKKKKKKRTKRERALPTYSFVNWRVGAQQTKIFLGSGYSAEPGQIVTRGYSAGPGQTVPRGYSAEPGQTVPRGYSAEPGQIVPMGYSAGPGQIVPTLFSRTRLNSYNALVGYLTGPKILCISI